MKANAKFINTEKIEGYVYSTGSNFNQLSERVAGPESKHPGTKYIAGDLDIAVDEAGLNVITIHYSYVTPTYQKSGQTNNTYVALKNIIDNPGRTWLEGGKENAFKVQCTGTSLAVNDFIAADGTKVAALRNENGFCSIVNELGAEADRNAFTTDILILKVNHIDADEEKNIPADFATVNGYIFGYGPVIIPVSLVVRNEMGIKYFEDLDATPSNPVFTKVWGRINCLTVKIERTEESAWGEAAVQSYERKNREYLITGTAKVPYDFGSEDVLTVEDVKKMLQNREVALAEVQKRFDKRQLEKATGASADFSAIASGAAAKIPEGKFKF